MKNSKLEMLPEFHSFNNCDRLFSKKRFLLIQQSSIQSRQCVNLKHFSLLMGYANQRINIEANFEMPCKAGGIGTIVPGLFKAKAKGNLLQNLG